MQLLVASDSPWATMGEVSSDSPWGGGGAGVVPLGNGLSQAKRVSTTPGKEFAHCQTCAAMAYDGIQSKKPQA